MSPRRRIALLAVIINGLLLAGSPSPRCETDPPGAHTIPFILQQDKVVISVRVNDSPEIKVLLDTGMQFEGLFLYKQELKDQMGIEAWSEIGVAGAGGGSAANAVQADGVSFTSGDASFIDQRIVVLQNDSFAKFPRDGVIGYSLFGRHAVEIDHDKTTIALYEPGSVEPGPEWHRIPLTFKDKIPWVEVALNLDGSVEIPVSAYIDLASREAIELLLFEGMKYQLPGGLEDYYLGRGLSGDINGYKGRVASLGLGDFTFRNVTAAFADAKVRSKQPGADGVLGNGLLMRFNQLFDYATGALYIRPSRHFEEPFD